jgi:hypothetical protein
MISLNWSDVRELATAAIADPIGFGVAVARFAASGAKLAAPETAAARLIACSECDRRDGSRCRDCGCNLRAKAAAANESCPLDRWPTSAAAAKEAVAAAATADVTLVLEWPTPLAISSAANQTVAPRRTLVVDAMVATDLDCIDTAAVIVVPRGAAPSRDLVRSWAAAADDVAFVYGDYLQGDAVQRSPTWHVATFAASPSALPACLFNVDLVRRHAAAEWTSPAPHRDWRVAMALAAAGHLGRHVPGTGILWP